MVWISKYNGCAACSDENVRLGLYGHSLVAPNVASAATVSYRCPTSAASGCFMCQRWAWCLEEHTVAGAKDCASFYRTMPYLRWRSSFRAFKPWRLSSLAWCATCWLSFHVSQAPCNSGTAWHRTQHPLRAPYHHRIPCKGVPVVLYA